MNDEEYAAFLRLLMCSDPWPVDDAGTLVTLNGLANKEAVRRGYADWIDAYHRWLP